MTKIDTTSFLVVVFLVSELSLIRLLIMLPTDFLLRLSRVYVGGFSPGNFSLNFFLVIRVVLLGSLLGIEHSLFL